MVLVNVMVSAVTAGRSWVWSWCMCLSMVWLGCLLFEDVGAGRGFAAGVGGTAQGRRCATVRSGSLHEPVDPAWPPRAVVLCGPLQPGVGIGGVRRSGPVLVSGRGHGIYERLDVTAVDDHHFGVAAEKLAGHVAGPPSRDVVPQARDDEAVGLDPGQVDRCPEQGDGVRLGQGAAGQ